eukprot:scaffold9178_cov176-Amphora_coffeaeformis.AAC.20
MQMEAPMYPLLLNFDYDGLMSLFGGCYRRQKKTRSAAKNHFQQTQVEKGIPSNKPHIRDGVIKRSEGWSNLPNGKRLSIGTRQTYKAVAQDGHDSYPATTSLMKRRQEPKQDRCRQKPKQQRGPKEDVVVAEREAAVGEGTKTVLPSPGRPAGTRGERVIIGKDSEVLL